MVNATKGLLTPTQLVKWNSEYICVVCRARERLTSEGSLVCLPCHKGYVAAVGKDDSVWAIIEWAAKRARHFEKARARKRKTYRKRRPKGDDPSSDQSAR